MPGGGRQGRHKGLNPSTTLAFVPLLMNGVGSNGPGGGGGGGDIPQEMSMVVLQSANLPQHLCFSNSNSLGYNNLALGTRPLKNQGIQRLTVSHASHGLGYRTTLMLPNYFWLT